MAMLLEIQFGHSSILISCFWSRKKKGGNWVKKRGMERGKGRRGEGGMKYVEMEREEKGEKEEGERGKERRKEGGRGAKKWRGG